jgi:hypothetical protein
MLKLYNKKGLLSIKKSPGFQELMFKKIQGINKGQRVKESKIPRVKID